MLPGGQYPEVMLDERLGEGGAPSVRSAGFKADEEVGERVGRLYEAVVHADVVAPQRGGVTECVARGC